MKELSIILVNWNCITYTEQCLASIRDTVRDSDFEVIVIDNHSADAPCHTLIEQFPWITLLLSDENLGFGRANNLAVNHSTGQYLLFLNPDTLLIGDALKQMLLALKRLPRGGAVGCKLLNPDGTLQSTCVQPFPTIANQLLAVGWLQRRWPALPLWGRQAAYANEPGKVHDVDFVSGAAILVRRDVFLQVGGFNPDYFMYAEETELCLAIHSAGYKVGHTGDALITHFGGQSTKTCHDSFAPVTMRDSVYRFFRRNRGGAYAAAYRLGILLSAACRVMVLSSLFSVVTLLGYSSLKLDIKRALRKWLDIAQWAVGLEICRLASSSGSSVQTSEG
jgi:GT2 family glycosyltransferase